MADFKFELDLEGFQKSLSSYDAEVGKSLDKAVKNCVLAIQRDSKKDCPVDTGRLRGSIVTKTSHLEGTVGSNLEYAPYIEYGTHKVAARPFLRPAYEKNIVKLETEVKKALGV